MKPARLFLSLLMGSFCTLHAQAPAANRTSCSIAVPPATTGDQALKAEDFTAAELDFQKQTAAPGATDAAWAGLVKTEIELNKVSAALDTAEHAVSLFPKSAAARSALGDAQYRAAHFDQAQTAYTAAVALDACSPAAHAGIGKIFLLSAMYGSAIKQLALAHRLSPADDSISEMLFELLPSKMRAQGLTNLLKSSQGLSPAHHDRLAQEAALATAGADGRILELVKPVSIPMTPLYVSGRALRDYGLSAKTAAGTVALDLDSTVDGIVLTQNDAVKLGVTPAIAGATTPPYSGYIDSLEIGDARFGRTTVRVVPDSALYRGGYSVIGLGFFHDALIHIDWNAKQITLAPFPDPATPPDALATDIPVPEAEHDWAPVLLVRGRMMAPAMLDGKALGMVVPDTSYVLNSISDAAAEHLHHDREDTLNIEGVDGPVVRMYRKTTGAIVRRTDLFSPEGKEEPVNFVGYRMVIRFAGIQQDLPSVWNFNLAPFSHELGTEVSAIVGFHALRFYYLDLDFRHGRMKAVLDKTLQFHDADPQVCSLRPEDCW